MLVFLRPILPEIILLFGGCIVLLLDVFKKHIHYLNVILVGILMTCIVVISYFSNDGLFYHRMFWVSTFTQLIKILLLAFTLFYFMATSKVIDKYELNKNEHNVMVLFMLIGMCLMISSNHFIVLYVGVEIQSLAAYTLAAMQRKSQFSAEAGMKYFILGSLASIVYLFGVSYIYGAVSTLYLHEFVNLHTKGIELGAMLILISFLFKFGLFPFHQWVPDIYQGAPTPSTSILATLSKIGAIAILVRLTIGVFSAAFSFVNLEFILTCVSIGSMIIGAVVPITQVYLKRLLGYSAVGHAGFIIMGLLGRNPDGAAIIISYMIVYILSLMTVFICVMSLKNKESASEENNDLLLSKLEGLAQIRPKHALLLSVCFLSMAGLPPFIGFFPKLLILQHIINQQEWLIAGVAVCTTVIGLFYYLKLVKLMYIDVPTKQSVALTVRVNKKLWMVFWPILFVHLLGIYVPILQKLHQQYIVSAAGSLFVGFNEKNYP